MPNPILPTNLSDPTGVDRLERGAIRELNTIIRQARGLYFEALERIGYQPVVNEKYSFAMDSETLLDVLKQIGDDVDDLFLRENRGQIWFFADYVGPAYQRGTAQEHANLASQSAAYAEDRVSLNLLLQSESYRQRVGTLRARIVDEVKSLAARVKSGFVQAFTEGIGRGLIPSSIRNALRGSEKKSQKQAALVARTEVAGALRNGRIDEAESAQDTGLRVMLFHVSALTATTRPSHAARHGRLFTIAAVRAWYAQGGNRFNCKCTQLAVLVNKDGKPLYGQALERFKGNYAVRLLLQKAAGTTQGDTN